MRPLSIEDAKRNRDEKIEKAKGLLADAVGRLQSGDDWKAMLAKLARGGRFSIRRLSFRNQLLVEIQSPGTPFVASYLAWQRAGRQVRKGEKSLVILAPLIVNKAKKVVDPDLEEEHGRKVLVGFKPLATFAGSQTPPTKPSPTASRSLATSLLALATRLSPTLPFGPVGAAIPGSPVDGLIDALARSWSLPAKPHVHRSSRLWCTKSPTRYFTATPTTTLAARWKSRPSRPRSSSAKFLDSKPEPTRSPTLPAGPAKKGPKPWFFSRVSE